MRYSSTALALLALSLATASPIAQDTGAEDSIVDVYGGVEDQIPDPVSVPSNGKEDAGVLLYDPTPIISSAVADATSGSLSRRVTDDGLRRRTQPVSCQPYPAGNGPAVVSPADDDTSFSKYQPFIDAATAAPTPSGYVQAFQNLAGSVTASAYMGYDADFTSYDVAACASRCSAKEGCVSFNMFYERNPTLNADDDACPNPASLTRIKCSYWGVPVSQSDATNVGQYQSRFHVVISGSNAYTNVPVSPQGFSEAWIQNAAIMSPTADNSYMGVQTFPGQPYDPKVCADACNAKSAYNTKHAAAGTAPRTCKFFGAYLLYNNGQNPLFTCTYYTQAYGPSYAKNKGQYDSAGNHYTINHSYTFTLSSQ